MIKFVYFDLGKVLVDFSHEKMCQQMADISGSTQSAVQKLMFENGLNERADRGDITVEQFYHLFCDQLAVKPDCDMLVNAAADIFTLNHEVVSLAKTLSDNGIRAGILSNTCQIHWDHVTGNFGDLLDLFETFVLSFEIRTIKPEPDIYHYAIDMADCLPDNIFFTDDRRENVIGAKNTGIDAVQFTDPIRLGEQLARRGLI